MFNVEATIINLSTDEKLTIVADYMVAADGAYSPTRQALNIAMEGKDNLGEFCNIYCEMDLAQWVADRPSIGFMFTNLETLGGVLLSVDGKYKWLVGIRYDFDKTITKETFTEDYCIEAVKKIINIDGLDVKLINRAFWTMAALVAQQYHSERIFLAGDAAHRLPPTGGLGMNTGVQDAHNLAWKLAAVIKGYGGVKLLDTYGVERIPVAVKNIQWSAVNAERFSEIFEAIYKGNEEKARSALQEENEHLNNPGLSLGFRYEQGAIQVNEDKNPPELIIGKYMPSTYPGCRAPHCLVDIDGKTVSILDLFEKDFVLLSSKVTDTWHEAVKSFNHPLLRSIQIDSNHSQEDWLNIYEIKSDGAVLVRPDGHVAWRNVNKVENTLDTIIHIMKKILFCDNGIAIHSNDFIISPHI